MAKAAKPAPVATATASVSPFKIEVGAPPPAIERKVGQPSSPFTAAMKSLPAPSGDQVAQFFVPIDPIAATVTDPTEKAQAEKDAARKLSNRISGISRRVSEEIDGTGTQYAFALRTKIENGVMGVRVYRVAPAEVVAAPPAA